LKPHTPPSPNRFYTNPLTSKAPTHPKGNKKHSTPTHPKGKTNKQRKKDSNSKNNNITTAPITMGERDGVRRSLIPHSRPRTKQ